MTTITTPRQAVTPLVKPVESSRVLHYDRGIAKSRRHAAREFLTWAEEHGRETRLHDAGLAQITTHPDLMEEQNAIAQTRAWAKRRTRTNRLHRSALTHLRAQRSAVV
ncbi:hypothetical protein EVJ50_04315 [Synechococcus sp. RSCCF101]|uniref:hypothetical protein n=1 Tax=Synechococcus sp. RSCCF101 TaxID=2511069 RepID=UPI0012484F13|nr:hypothetical protein [Synechococcus sp. RSCCF101]QEY31595.1 hypothetical protein EVJ50_04315 [Synechococcus sp. RSCCF101]